MEQNDDRIFDKTLLNSIIRHLKDIAPIVILLLVPIIGVCMVDVPATTTVIGTVAAEDTVKTLSCFEMMRYISLVCVILLLFNAALVGLGIYHEEVKTPLYYMIYCAGNILSYIGMILIAISGLACKEEWRSCNTYKDIVIVISIFMMIVYIYTLFSEVKNRMNAEKQLKAFLNNELEDDTDEKKDGD